MQDVPIAVAHLTRSYGKRRGVIDLDFTVGAGEIFGFVGPNLTSGAVAAGCTRCVPATIEAHLQSLEVLDVDGDGDAVALTDGVLVLRAMFGFSGAALTAGAVGTDCTRCEAASIGPFLDELM